MAPEAMTSESLQILNGDIDNWSRLVTTALIIHPPRDNSPSPPALVLRPCLIKGNERDAQ